MMDAVAIGWRDGVVLIAVLMAVYVVYTLLRLSRLGKPRHGDGEPPAAVPPSLTSATRREFAGPMIDLSIELPPELLAKPAPPTAAPPAPQRVLVQELQRPAVAAPRLSAASQAAPDFAPSRGAEEAADFARHLARSSIEVELAQLRRESRALSEEVAHLREELASLKAARNVSPLYGEAMALAQQGAPASGIAGQCGISLAEAELVAALARGLPEEQPDEFGEEPNDGYSDSGTRNGTHG